MRFEWDPAKEARNRRRHGFGFSIARGVFLNPHEIIHDRVEGGEDRWHAIGYADGVNLLVVVHAYPDPDDEDRVRVISLRKATENERREYRDG